MINYVKIFALVLCIFDVVFGLKVRTPSIFGRRVTLTDQSMRSVFENSSVVPDVIDSVPLIKVKVRYPSGPEVNLGNELTPADTKDEPRVEWSTEMAKYYTLVMIDPDVPSRTKPTKREFNHWLVVNIPGTDITKGTTFAAYRGPSPSKRSGIHRYVFLVHKQSGLINATQPMIGNSSREGRLHFNTRVFAKTHDLGEPIAANFFVAQYDDYVRFLRTQHQTQHQAQPGSTLKSESQVSVKRSRIIDWAPRKPKTPKFPQMICINYDKYIEMQNNIGDKQNYRQNNNKID